MLRPYGLRRFGEGSVFVELESPPRPDRTLRCGLGRPRSGFRHGAARPFLSHILGPAGVSAGAITNLANETKSTYDVRNIRAQQPYWIAFDEDSVQPARYFVYQRNATQYARFDLRPPYGVTLEPYPTDTLIERAQGVIESSLYVDLERVGAPTNLALSMAAVYAWTVDFSSCKKGMRSTYCTSACRQRPARRHAPCHRVPLRAPQQDAAGLPV